MNASRKLAVLMSLLSVTACRRQAYVAPEAPLPANTVLLSQMMHELSAQPGYPDKLLAELGADKNRGGKIGAAVLTPGLMDELRKRTLGKDWSGLDRFPGWTMHEITPTVDAIGMVAGGSQASPASFLDVGPYALDKAETVSLETPSTLPGFTTQGIVTDLGDGIVRGDRPNDLAGEHAESQRLADLLNRLAANGLDGAQPFAVWRSWDAQLAEFPAGSGRVDKPDLQSRSPDQLVRDLQATGNTVTVTDSRYFANFAHLHFNGKDVMAPFWLNSEIVVPNSGGRPLLVPVAHAELEWHVRGPKIDADVSYYFGDDGKSEWRTMDTLDQAWVMKRDAHTYTGADAVEVTRLAELLTVAYMHQHMARPQLPFGGYYALGVCQDGVSAIEHRMTGAVTLYPNTVDAPLFNDPRDKEINALMAAIPKDRDGSKPEPERIFGSLPTTDFNAIAIPGLGADLTASYAAWKDGSLERTHTAWQAAKAWLFLGSAVGMGILLAWLTHRYMHKQKTQLLQKNPYRR
jgi:hypothetical protein